jgi:4a-hydroxytetrahydrobiopterin dehydratase
MELNLQDKWKVSHNTIHAVFVFRDFKEAMQFMVKAGECADGADHHPDWSNVYKTVKVSLSTHSEKGITDKDFSLAKEMLQIYNERSYLRNDLF